MLNFVCSTKFNLLKIHFHYYQIKFENLRRFIFVLVCITCDYFIVQHQFENTLL